MSAGRELDRVVAERLGYTEIEAREEWYDTPENTYQKIGLYGRIDGDVRRIWDYSTSLSSAYTLLAPFAVWHITKMGTGRIVVDLWDDGWSISWKNENEIETVELAICRAVLSWKESRA